jgi:hypothetical protein
MRVPPALQPIIDTRSPSTCTFTPTSRRSWLSLVWTYRYPSKQPSRISSVEENRSLRSVWLVVESDNRMSKTTS